MPTYFLPELLFRGGSYHKEQFIEVDDMGVIQRIGPIRDLTSEGLNSAVRLGGITLPGMVNSHSHAFQVLLRGTADNPKNFKDWVRSHLYPLVRKLRREDIYTASKVAFAEMLRNGITTVGEFHYLHNLHPDEEPDIHSNDPLTHEVIRAAKDVGIRIRLLYTGYDLGTKPGQERFHRTVGEVIESLNTLHEHYLRDPMVHIGAAPHSLHGASEEMIRSMVSWAKEKGEVVHIHLSEQRSDVQECMEQHGMRPVEYLEDRGFLAENLAIVHGIWLEGSEISTIANHGTKHVYNPLTNMHLGDGTAPIVDYVARDVVTALGTDANINMNILHEARTAEWLQRVQSLEMGRIGSVSFGRSPSQIMYDMCTVNGGKALGLPVGAIEEGNYADFITIDPSDTSLTRSVESPHFLDQLISSASLPHILSSVYVGGVEVYSRESGHTRSDYNELVRQFRSLKLD